MIHVIETLVVMDLEEALTPFQTEIRASLVRDARLAWQAFAAAIPGASALDFSVEINHPAAAILRRVREQAVDLLVLGMHGTSPPDDGAGTLATACVRKAKASVLLVRQPHVGPFRSVVACVDFSDTSRRALARAVRMAANEGASLHVLHVFQAPWQRLHYRAPTPQASPDYQKQYRDGLERRLKAFCEPFEPEIGDLKPRYDVVANQSHGRGIAEFVNDTGGDLVVLGTRGRMNVRDILLGSTAERVVRTAPCSILTVAPEERRRPARTERVT